MRKELSKALVTNQDDAEAHEPGTENVGPGDRLASTTDLDDAPRGQGTEHRPCPGVDQRRVDPLEHCELAIDSVDFENGPSRIEADHKDVGPLAVHTAAPFRRAKIERGCLRHLRCRPRSIEPASRELAGLRLVFVLARGHQQIELQVVVKQHPALRDGEEEAELDEDQQDRHKHPGDREHRASLIVRQYTPSEPDPCRPTNTAEGKLPLCHLPDSTPGRNFLQRLRVGRQLNGDRERCPRRQRNTLTWTAAHRLWDCGRG